MIDEHAILELLATALHWHEECSPRDVTACGEPGWVRQAREIIDHHYREDPHAPLPCIDDGPYMPEP